MRRIVLAVTALLFVAVLAAPVVAEPADTSIRGTDRVAPGDTVTYTFIMTNSGENASSYVLNASVPEAWEIVDRSDDGSWKQSETKWLYRSVAPGATKEPALTFSVPDGTDAESASFTLKATDNDGLANIAVKNVTVEQGNSGGGGSDDDSSGGGSDDDSSGGESDDDSSGGESGDDTYSGGTDTTATEEPTTERELVTETTDESETGTATEEPTTEREPVTETTDESERETDTGPSATSETDGAGGSAGNSVLGIILGALLLLTIGGVGVVSVRRTTIAGSTTDEPASGATQTSVSAATPTGADEVSASGSEFDTAAIDVVEWDTAQTECTLEYATTETSNKAIGDEIREIARQYAAAGADDIGTQRLVATVTDGSQTVATWHIRSEWLRKFDDDALSEAEFERKVVGTLSLSG